jgi:hypothetical protein
MRQLTPKAPGRIPLMRSCIAFNFGIATAFSFAEVLTIEIRSLSFRTPLANENVKSIDVICESTDRSNYDGRLLPKVCYLPGTSQKVEIIAVSLVAQISQKTREIYGSCFCGSTFKFNNEKNKIFVSNGCRGHFRAFYVEKQ